MLALKFEAFGPLKHALAGKRGPEAKERSSVSLIPSLQEPFHWYHCARLVKQSRRQSHELVSNASNIGQGKERQTILQAIVIYARTPSEKPHGFHKTVPLALPVIQFELAFVGNFVLSSFQLQHFHLHIYIIHICPSISPSLSQSHPRQ